MDKSKMAAKLARQCDLSVAKAKEVLNTIFDTRPGRGLIAVELDAGRKVVLHRFGSFSTRRRDRRNGRNPATGAPITIPEKVYPRFTASKSFRERIAR